MFSFALGFLERRSVGFSSWLVAAVLGGSATLAHADPIFFHPFENRLYRWNGSELSDALDPAAAPVKVTLDGDPLVANAPAIGWKPGRALFASEFGQLVDVELATGAATIVFRAKDGCQGALNYSGCIYSITLAGPGRAYFLEHQRNGSDSVREFSGAGARTLIEGVPGPSGPIWIRPDGHLGALPYGLGIVDLPLPLANASTPIQYSTLSATVEPWLTMAAGFAAEGLTSAGQRTLLIHDFTSIVRRTNGVAKSWIETLSAAFDPCTGTVWVENEGEILPFSEATLGELPVNPAACPLAVEWQVIERTGATTYNDRLDVIQGLPSGTSRVPSQKVLPLGAQGSITLQSTRALVDGAGDDLTVFENAFIHTDGMFAEPARVEIGDGARWISTGCDCNDPQAKVCAGMQVTQSQAGNGVPAWSKGGGFGIDLAEFGLTAITQVRITDCGRSSATPDGNPGKLAGFDLDAIVVTPRE